MHGAMQSRIHSSKSVPSLNSDVGDNRMNHNTLAPPMLLSPGDQPSTSRYAQQNYPPNASMIIHPQAKPPAQRHTESMEVQHSTGFRSR